MHKGLVFYFFALRSGYCPFTYNSAALTSDGADSGDWVPMWFAVRPAHELTCICHSEFTRHFERSEKSHKLWDTSPRLSVTREKNRYTGIPFFKKSGTELFRVEGNFVLPWYFYCHSERSEESHKIMGLFAKAQSDTICHSEQSKESQNKKRQRFKSGMLR